ncbi:unnamed protein product, partial [Laminaria digitata]
LNGLSYVPSTAKLDLLDALAEAGVNPIKSCLQAQWHMEQAAIKSGAMGPNRRSPIPGGSSSNHPANDASQRSGAADNINPGG